jgi:hypothetical protein
MTALQYAAGLGRLAAFVVPLGYAAARVRGRLTTLAGAPAVLADVVIGLSLALVLAEVLGSLSALKSGPLIAAALAVALLAGLWDRRRPRAALDPPPGAAASTRPPSPSLRDPTTVAALVAVALVVAQWGLQTANSLGAGMNNFDTLWYHMPFAAGFAQAGSVTGLQYTQADPLVALFPANSELLHALGIVTLHRDIASPLLNLGWLGIALLAGWCVGRPWRRGAATLAAVALVLSTPVMATTQPGQASNDIVGLAMVLAASALLVCAEWRVGAVAVAGLAAGIAVGTKVTMLVPGVALIAFAIIFAPSARRAAVAAAGAAGLLLTGSFWYARNLLDIGNPFGVLHVHFGPLDLPAPDSPLERFFHYSLLTHAGRTSLWTSRITPGLHEALGPLWWLLLLAAAVGAIGALVRSRERLARVLALTAVASAVAYAALPTSASFLQTSSHTFALNLRYATPALALGLVLFASLRWLAPAPRHERWVVPAFALAIVITQFASNLWPDQPARHAAALVLALVGAVAAVAVAPRLRTLSRGALIAGVALLLGVGVGVGFAAQRHYLRQRYSSYARDRALGQVFRWAQAVRGARIAVAGTVLGYPLYGRDVSNRVVYVGRRAPHGGFGPIHTCAAWRAALTRGRFYYVVVAPLNLVALTSSPEAQWTRDDPSASLALDAGGGDVVFAIKGPLHACAPGEPVR